jgi:uncharacterized membrane protein
MSAPSLVLVLIVALLFILTSIFRIRKGVRYLREQDSLSQRHSRINIAVYGQIIVGIFLISLWLLIAAVILTNAISHLVN